MTPANAKSKHIDVENKLNRLAADAEKLGLFKTEKTDKIVKSES